MRFQFIFSYELLVTLIIEFASPLTTRNGIFVRNYSSSSATILKTPALAPPVIVILHGLLDSSESFIEWSQEITHEMKKAFGLSPIMLGIDTPGHGLSPKQSSLDYLTCADVVSDTLLELRQVQAEFCCSGFHIIGHSTGGKLAAAIAMNCPSLVSTLTFVDVIPVKFPDSCWNPIKASIQKIYDIPVQDIPASELMSYLECVRMPSKLRILLNRSTRYQQGSKSMREWTFDIEQVMKSLHHLQSFPKPEDFKYKDYKGNVLVLRGDPKKTFYVQDSDIKEVRSFFTNIEVFDIKDAGHWLHSEKCSLTAQKVADFIGSSHFALAPSM